jgi:hypothetical protein
MNTTMSRGLTRLVAGPVVAAGIIGGALGLAAVANASTAVATAHPSNGTTVQQKLHEIQSSPHDTENPVVSPQRFGDSVGVHRHLGT